VTKRLLKELGTVGLFKLINLIDMLPHRNFQDNVHDKDKLDLVSGEAVRDTILDKSGACYRCPIACQRHTTVEGKHGEGPEYETTVMMGPTCDIYDLCAITRANYLCNELGLDTISVGGTLACAMELYEKGRLTKEEAGMELAFGSRGMLEEPSHRGVGGLVVLARHLVQGVEDLLGIHGFQTLGQLRGRNPGANEYQYGVEGFHLEDPGERNDRFAELASERSDWVQQLAALAASLDPNLDPGEVPPEMEEHLKALGYF